MSPYLTFLSAFLIAVARGHYFSGNGSVYYDSASNTYVFKQGVIDPTAAAFGSFSDQSTRPSAFGELTINTGAKFSDNVQMYAAGFLEGCLTYERIPQHFHNLNSWLLKAIGDEKLPAAYEAWFDAQDKWMRSQIAANTTSPLWQQLGLIISQFDGLVAGYSHHAPQGKEMAKFQFSLLNAMGDIIDLMAVIQPEVGIPDWDSMTPQEIMQKLIDMNHCTGFIRATGNYSELYAGHSAWFTYSAMLRIYKHYNFRLSSTATASGTTSFSSYPGVLSSLDDFYQMWDSNLIMVQTTNSILNKTLYQNVHTDSLLAWQRVRLANQVATGGRQWCDIIGFHNSGTYNNQYMLVNLNLWSPGKAMKENLLWVCEQIPGYVEAQDVTPILERGYWGSYNVPAFKTIYDKSGYPEFIKKYSGTHDNTDPGPLSGIHYQLAPRGKIFRRDAGKVETMEQFMAFMRSNDYENDPYFQPNPSPYDAICSRGDLAGNTGGCYDSKVTSYSWFQQRRVAAVNGPTTANGTLPVFKWTPQFTAAHEGQPDVFDFHYEEFYAKWT